MSRLHTPNRHRFSLSTAAVATMALVILLQSLSGVVRTVAAEPESCQDNTTSSSDSTDSSATDTDSGALSQCQKDIYDSGIYAFDEVVGSQTCSVSVDPTLSGSDNQQILFNYLSGQSFGGQKLADFQVAAIVGNLMWESGGPSGRIDPAAKNPTSGAYGIAQWLGGRLDNLKKLAATDHKPVSDLGVQMKYLLTELQGDESASISALLKTSDVSSATISFEQTFERAGEVAGSTPMNGRITNAQNVLAKYGSGVNSGSDQGNPNDPTAVPSSGDGTCATSGPGQDTQYVDGFTIYSQYDPAWKNNPYGPSTIGDSGCGPSAMAMIITALTSQKVTPADTTAYANTQNLYIPGIGSSWTIAPVLAKHWNLSAQAIGADTTKIAATLQSGGLVIGSGIGGLPFTGAGHYIVIRGIASDGKWLIGDSAHKDTNTQEWDPQQLLSEMHDGSIYAITKSGGAQTN